MKVVFCIVCSLLLMPVLHAGDFNDVPGKIYFSTQPFANSSAGSSNSFKSSDYIYGRLEVEGTIKDAFKLKADDKLHYLNCTLVVKRNGEQTGYERGSMNHFLLSNDDLNKNAVNFDVLPDPQKATTVFSMLEDFSAGLGFFPMYDIVQPETFRSPGTYTVELEIYSVSLNAWGKEDESDKWPTLKGSFEFQFDENDVSKLVKNRESIRDIIRENAFRYEKLPDVFSNPGTLNDPKATAAKISAILKRDLPERTILKFAAEKISGTQWNIAKDDYGLPKYRYFTPDIWVVYKMNGKCYIGTVTLRETYQGGGTYGPLQVGFTSASGQADKGIDCAKVK